MTITKQFIGEAAVAGVGVLNMRFSPNGQWGVAVSASNFDQFDPGSQDAYVYRWNGSTMDTFSVSHLVKPNNVLRPECWTIDNSGNIHLLTFYITGGNVTWYYYKHNGTSWSASTVITTTGTYIPKSIEVTSAGYLFAIPSETQSANIFASTNGGASWSSCYSFETGYTQPKFHKIYGDYLWLVIQHPDETAVLRRINVSTQTESAIATQVPAVLPGQIVPANNNDYELYYVSANTITGRWSIYSSTDTGNNWSSLLVNSAIPLDFATYSGNWEARIGSDNLFHFYSMTYFEKRRGMQKSLSATEDWTVVDLGDFSEVDVTKQHSGIGLRIKESSTRSTETEEFYYMYLNAYNVAQIYRAYGTGSIGYGAVKFPFDDFTPARKVFFGGLEDTV